MKSLSISHKMGTDSSGMKTKLARILYKAPISTAKGKLWLGAIIIFLFLVAFPAFYEYYLTYRLFSIAVILLAFLLFSPTLIALRYFDRREREPWTLVLLTIFSVTFFFGPVASRSLFFADSGFGGLWIAGFIKEFWKVAPLLLLLFFVPRAVGGTRDGLIYGALGGLGFAILEFPANNVSDNFSTMGWAVLTNGLGSATLLGTHNHIIWSAAVGAAIGWAFVAKPGVKRYLMPLAVYFAVAVLHIFNDKDGSILTTRIAGALFEPLALAQPNPEYFAHRMTVPFLLFAGTVNLLVINIVLLPVLFRILCRSGDTERRIIREHLEGEIGGSITREEFEGVVADRRYRTRKIDDLPVQVAKKIVQMQNEIAFHKAYAASLHKDPNYDPAVCELRKQIEIERFEVR